jgi:hypothetical protein
VFVVSEEAAAAIRAIFEEQGELSAAIELSDFGGKNISAFTDLMAGGSIASLVSPW